MVELLLTEFAQEYPEVMRPLLHDRCGAAGLGVYCVLWNRVTLPRAAASDCTVPGSYVATAT
jgi:hypothetical protein